MALLLCERQQNWLRVVNVVFRVAYALLLLRFFLRFLRFFFKIQKVVTFYVFCRVSYVFSNYGRAIGTLLRLSSVVCLSVCDVMYCG